MAKSCTPNTCPPAKDYSLIIIGRNEPFLHTETLSEEAGVVE